MRTLICGSIAYDTIMVFGDRFKNHILPDQLHILNVAFLVPDLRREFGGCAGNIAYNLAMLGGEPLIMATVGDDPGAMNHSHENHVNEAAGAKLGIVAPDGREGMLQHAREFHAAGVPFVFDPGQGLPMFGAEELNRFVDLASYVTVNDYEGRMLQERAGRKLEEIARGVQALVVTLGAKGSLVMANGKSFEVPPVPAAKVVDPTGCGDAYRAGLLYGIAAGLELPVAARLASVLGSIKIGSRGGQNHRFTRDEIAQRYREAYGSRPW
jgi:adenosine kinase